MNQNFLIILLNYNNWQDTLDCVKSLKASEVSEANILIIENFSSDDSYMKLSKEFPLIKILRMEKNLGFTGGNNVGIKYAVENKYEYAILLNNDTIVESSDTFKILIEEMDKNKYATLGTGRIYYYPQKELIWYDGGQLIRYRGMATHTNYRMNRNNTKLNDNLRKTNFVSGCYMCIRLKDITTLGYLNEKIFIYLDDVEYSARAIKKNMKILYIPRAAIYHKAKGENKRTPRMVYYSIRNRRLVINLHFGFIAKIYFEVVLIIKRMLWFFSNKKYYKILVQALSDYNKNYFGQAPDFIR
jgi:GT2 family glycosyltransferase